MSTIPMPVQPGADIVASYPLVAQLFGRHGFTRVDGANFDAFASRPGHALLLFLEDPGRFKEMLDIAVIVPELMRAFPGRFAVGVLLPEAARRFQARYGFNHWQALVMLNDGRYVGVIEGLRDWEPYVEQLTALLAAAPTRPPTVGIPVRGAAPPTGCTS